MTQLSHRHEPSLCALAISSSWGSWVKQLGSQLGSRTPLRVFSSSAAFHTRLEKSHDYSLLFLLWFKARDDRICLRLPHAAGGEAQLLVANKSGVADTRQRACPVPDAAKISARREWGGFLAPADRPRPDSTHAALCRGSHGNPGPLVITHGLGEKRRLAGQGRVQTEEG